MKKRTIFLVSIAIVVCMLIAVVAVGCTNNGIAYAVEANTEYTIVDENGTTWTITIVDETNCNLYDGTETTALTYTLVDGVLTIVNPTTNESTAFTVNEDNTLTLKVTDEPKPEPEPEKGDDTVTAEVDEKKLTEQVSQIISDFLGNYLQNSLVAQIITWLIDVGAMGALIGIFLKYRKYKHTTVEDVTKLAGETIKDQLGSSFKDLDGNTAQIISEALEAMNTVLKKMDTLLQAFALSQDKSSEGKIAMLQLVQGTTEDKKVVEKIEEIKTEIVATDEAVHEVEEKVQGEYHDIF